MSSYPQKQQSQGNSGGRLADYIGVAERIGDFYRDHPQGRINSTIVEHDLERGFILMRAEVYRQPDDALPSGTGHAYEMKSEGHVNKTSYIENCETGAVGRALANLGYETKRSGNGTQNAPKLSPAPTPRQEQCASDEWACGSLLQKVILDLEAALDSKGIGSTVVRDKLEENFNTRNPATLSVEQAKRYKDYLSKKYDAAGN
jgi:hypothetical protein